MEVGEHPGSEEGPKGGGEIAGFDTRGIDGKPFGDVSAEEHVDHDSHEDHEEADEIARGEDTEVELLGGALLEAAFGGDGVFTVLFGEVEAVGRRFADKPGCNEGDKREAGQDQVHLMRCENFREDEES